MIKEGTVILLEQHLSDKMIKSTSVIWYNRNNITGNRTLL